LKGIKLDLTKCVRVSAHKLKGLLKKKSVTHVVQLRSIVSGDKATTSECVVTDLSEPLSSLVKLPSEVPPSVQSLVQQYEHLFYDLAILAPPRTFDHRISLLPSA